MKYPYVKAAGMALFIHIAVLGLAGLVASRIAATPPPGPPPPIEVEFEPPSLLDMGSGDLQSAQASPPPGRPDAENDRPHFTPESPPPPEPKPAAKPKTPVARKPATPKPTHPRPTPPEQAPAPPSTTQPVPPALPGETTPASVALPVPGDKNTEGSNSEWAAESASGGGKSGAARGEGALAGGGGSSARAGLISGELPVYPDDARRSGREEVVTVRLLVGADGVPASVTVRDTSGREDFDNVAVRR
jgi:outer membrane biosynthesis protein TonB